MFFVLCKAHHNTKASKESNGHVSVSQQHAGRGETQRMSASLTSLGSAVSSW